MNSKKQHRRQQRVYAAYRSIFNESKAKIRSEWRIRIQVAKHEGILQSLSPMTIDGILEQVCFLLRNGVFESEIKARLLFPDLFPSLPLGDTVEKTPRNETAESVARASSSKPSDEANGDESDDCHAESLEADHVKDTIRGAEKNCNDEASSAEDVVGERAIVQDDTSDKISMAANLLSATDRLPTLSPVHIQYKIQHFLLDEIERQLKVSCFNSVHTTEPLVLEEQSINCPEALDLEKWLWLLQKLSKQLSPYLFNSAKQELNVTLEKAQRLHGLVVRQIKLAATDIVNAIENAAALAFILRDHERATLFKKISAEVCYTAEIMVQMKNDAEVATSRKLLEIQRKRGMLDMEEKAAINSMLEHDAENTATMNKLLELSLSELLVTS
ncbi:hypothetical protein BKA67DRAFT_391106 [Truncatella angustata]|uniref:Uncharacterized protein n=1 Tax=Truncatella angustata TaxID=152316 RepID=A0A9P8RK54_9PEZI|nr:uncharacterized protein BKA67DRAFT_391106 [Truncatella angustata]KAH6647546.1 hypothetical protein BKA67DRAFT_391106 [Truncatella angustata]KAH8194073.1 hypothetical protein TruAng_011765 [Truncatella angustata]